MKIIYQLKQLMLLFLDILSFAIGLWLAISVRKMEPTGFQLLMEHLEIFIIIFVIWTVINYINGLYDLLFISKKNKTYKRFIETAVLSLVVGIVFLYLFPSKSISPKTILLLTIIFGYGISFTLRIFYEKFIKTKKMQTNVLFVGFIEETKEIIKILEKNPECGYKIAGLIDPEHSVKSSDFAFDVYHGLHTIRPAISTQNAHIVVITPNLTQDQNALRELYNLLFWETQITDLTNFYESLTGRIPPCTFSEGWFLQNLRNNEKPFYNKFKNITDLLFAIILGIFFVALLPFTALAIKLTSDGSVFFKQKRVGRFGREFDLYKFRSMYSLSEDGSAELNGAQFAKKNDDRITTAGKLLRKTRLDELPQIINILKGDISVIGPRPERPEIVNELEKQMPYYSLRHTIKPGLTGWAVLHQNYTDDMESSLQKLQYDLYYIKNRSLLMDLSIILKTVNLVIRLMGQ